MSRPLLRSRSTALQWSAAAFAAAALYAFPWALVVAVTGGFALWLLLDLVALVLVALRLWSPLSTLGAALLSLAGAFAFFLITASAGSCDRSVLDVVALVLALVVGTVGVRRGAWALAAVPAGWILAALWLALFHHGSSGCFE